VWPVRVMLLVVYSCISLGLFETVFYLHILYKFLMYFLCKRGEISNLRFFGFCIRFKEVCTGF
jgi:hypothetical protein